jgi:replicative DNA helicase
MIDALQEEEPRLAGDAPRRADPGRVTRTPPHSIEAEQGVLGCLLLNPREGVGRCLERFPRDKEVFYDPRHQVIFNAVVELCDGNSPVDLVTIGQRLRDQQSLESVGGYPYLNSLIEAVPSAANLDYYADIVREKYLLRRVITTCNDIVSRVYDEQDDADGFLDRAEQEFLAISQERAQNTSDDIQSLVQEAMGKVEKYCFNPEELAGLPTGFEDLDRKTSGLHGGEMLVIAARPSMGKTSLAMNIAEHVAVNQGEPVGVFSLEMTGESLVLRMLCSLARLDQHKLREGALSEKDFARLHGAADQLSKARLYIDDTPGLTIRQLRGRARRLWEQHKIKLFVIDYLQLLHSSNSRRNDYNRQQEIAEISNGIKALAKELNVPILVLSQLNRELERDKNRKPRLSDLRESGAIEQDADLVALLYRADRENPRKAASMDDEDDETRHSDATPVNLLIAKQRNGPTGDVHLTFLRSFTRFESATLYTPDDIPPEG